MGKQIKAILISGLLVGWFFLSQYITAWWALLIGSEQSIATHQFLITLLSYLLVLGVPVGWDTYRKRDIFEGYRGFNFRRFYIYIIYGIGLWLVTTFVNALFLPFFPEYGSEVDMLFENKEHILRFITIVIGAPIVEEYIFRGKIQRALQKGFGKPLAIILQGVLFGVIHPFGLQKIYASLLGIGFGWIRATKDNTMTSTIMHMTINFIGWFIGIWGAYFLM